MIPQTAIDNYRRFTLNNGSTMAFAFEEGYFIHIIGERGVRAIANASTVRATVTNFDGIPVATISASEREQAYRHMVRTTRIGIVAHIQKDAASASIVA